MLAYLVANTCRTRAALGSEAASLKCLGLNGGDSHSPQSHKFSLNLYGGTWVELILEAPKQPRTGTARWSPDRHFWGTTDRAHRCRHLHSILLEDEGPPLRTCEVGGTVQILPKLRPELSTVLCLPATGETTGCSWWIVPRSDSKAGMTPRTASLCYHVFTL